MLKKFRTYFMENMDTIVAGLASLNGGDYRPYIER